VRAGSELSVQRLPDNHDERCASVDVVSEAQHASIATHSASNGMERPHASVGGTEEEWAALDDSMAAEGHTAVLVRPVRVYSNSRGQAGTV
jgi:hypothetical protein